MYNLPDNAQLYADGNRGVYIPQYFAESVDRDKVSRVSFWAWDGLLIDPYGVDSDLLWECWTHILDNAVLTDDNGDQWNLYQDGDLWLVPSDWVPNDDDDEQEGY